MRDSKYIDVAVLAADEAGKVHKKYFNTDLEIKTKSNPFDLLTVADIEAEKAIVSVIKKHYPEHNILAEEAKYAKTNSAYTWIIDPLDGTNNFAYKIPMFCASIALAKDGELLLGVVYDVMRNELFTTQRNRGAALNGKRIKVANTDTLKGSLLITGFHYDRSEQMSETLKTIRRFLLEHIIGIRRFGSAALDLCFVACGRASGFWEFELNPWDFAAGKLIIQEAGGRVTGRNGKDIGLEKSFIVASNGKIHDKMLEVLMRKKIN